MSTRNLSEIQDGESFVLVEDAGSVTEGMQIIRMNGSFYSLRHDSSQYGDPLEIPGDPKVMLINFPTDWKVKDP